MAHYHRDHALLDRLLFVGNLKNDAALARALEVQPPVISKIRNGTLPVGPRTILRAHEKFGVPVKEIRGLLADGA